MIFLRNLVLAVVMAFSLVMAQDDEEATLLRQCASGEFEDSYFKFDISVDHVSEDCPDFEYVGAAIQRVIDKVQLMIPEFEKEEIDAELCSLPTFVGERRHLVRNRYKRGRYRFAGAGGCKRCRRNRAKRRLGSSLALEQQGENVQHSNGRQDRSGAPARRELDAANDRERFEERVCETLVGSVVVDAAVAEMAVVKGEEKLNALSATAKEKETKDLLDSKRIDKYIFEAQKSLDECKREKASANARALFVEKACESEDFGTSVVTPEDQEGFETAAKELDEEIERRTKEAQKDYYRVKDQGIRLKGEIIKLKFEEIESNFDEDIKELQDDLNKEAEKVKAEMKKIERKMKDAKKKKDKEVEEELQAEMEMIEDKSKALEEEFDTFKQMEPKRIQEDYELAKKALDVEAANTVEDYMEAFKALMTRGLQGYLHFSKDAILRACFERNSKVQVEVAQLGGKDEKKAVLEACPEEEDDEDEEEEDD